MGPAHIWALATPPPPPLFPWPRVVAAAHCCPFQGDPTIPQISFRLFLLPLFPCINFLAWALSSGLHTLIHWLSFCYINGPCYLLFLLSPAKIQNAATLFNKTSSLSGARPAQSSLFFRFLERGFFTKQARPWSLSPRLSATDSLLPSQILKKPRDTCACTKGHCSF